VKISYFSTTGPKRARLRALVAAFAGTGAAAVLAAGLAVRPASAAAAPPPPAHGVTPGSAVVGSDSILAYTATDSSVWVDNLTTHQFTAGGGRLTTGPAAMADSTSLFLFGRGTDGALWENACNLFNLCGSWGSLGGVITSQPAAVLRGSNVANYSVYARGGDGALWGRDRSATGWGPWYPLGGQLLSGTGPSAAYLGGTYVLVVGTNRQLYIKEVGVTGFVPVGGQTTATPALTAVPSAQNLPAALLGLARGTDNAGHYHRFLSTSPGWHAIGGRLTTGLSASTQILATIPMTLTFGLGTDNRIWENIGTWGAYPPDFNGWKLTT
jgi:hypothetical protein